MPERPTDFITCPRCNLTLTYMGTKRFHEGTRVFDVLGGIMEMFKNREHYDVYCCPRCGRIEFFVDTIGEELRGEPPHETPLLFEGLPRPSDTDHVDWKCPACGEAVPGTFDVCWKCNAARQRDG